LTKKEEEEEEEVGEEGVMGIRERGEAVCCWIRFITFLQEPKPTIKL